MRALRRARLVLLAAVLLAAAVLVSELPIGSLSRERAALAAAGTELKVLDARDRALGADVSSLERRSTIESIARKEYGLVRPGQREYVVLPAGSARPAGTSSLAGGIKAPSLSAADLVAGNEAALAGSGIAGVPDPSKSAASPGIWSLALGHLEFWRWAF